MPEPEWSSLQVAQQATLLLRARAPERAHPQASALAREAARLLGIERLQSVTDSAAPALSAFERQRLSQAQAKTVGWLSRLREVFGLKKR